MMGKIHHGGTAWQSHGEKAKENLPLIYADGR
jgi:hypothetical protein